MSTKRRVFPETFKREAVDRVASSGLPIGKVAAELGLNETVLRRWVVRLGGEATGTARRPITQAPAPSPADLVSEVTRLRRENERLRMERDILKNFSWGLVPPVAVETDGVYCGRGEGAAVSFMVAMTPSKNVAHRPLRTCEW